MLIVARLLTPEAGGYGTHEQLFLLPCLFRWLTGLPCPFCGMTTAFALIADGRVVAAFNIHILGPAAYLATWAVLVAAIVGLVRDGMLLPRWLFSEQGGRVMLVILLVGWAVNDLMVIKGTANNDGVVTVTGIGGAPANLTISAAVNEAAGAYMSLYKQTPHSNNCVFDRRTGRMWSRNTSNGEAVGVLSDGTLNWYAVATLFPLHPVAADLQMIGPPANVLRIVNAAAEIDRYHVGDLIKCGGFANPANNLPGYYVTDVQIWAALSLDVYLEPVNNVLVSEVAAGARTIGLVTRSIFNYAAGANLIGLGGYNDWRVPNVFEGASLLNHEAVDGYPDPVAFPGWGNWVTWTSTTRASQNTSAVIIDWLGPYIQAWAKTGTRLFILVRG